MDIKAKIEEIITKVKEDPDLLKNLTSDPAGTIKNIIGIDISGEQITSIIDGIKEKINIGDITGDLGEKLSGILGNAGEGLGDTVKNIVGEAGGLGDTVKNLLGGKAEDAAEDAKDAVEDAVENAADSLGDKLMEGLGGIGEKLSGLFGGKKD